MTSDYDALIKVITARPEEDTPRLMLADWLEEHGQPERAAFLRDPMKAIIDHPDDDAPRLMMAEWLEEIGQKERARFIRAQLAYGKKVEFEGMSGETLNNNTQNWVEQGNRYEEWGIPGLRREDNGYLSESFRRGFLERIDMTPDAQTLEKIDLYARRAPIRSVRLSGHGGPNTHRFDESECLAESWPNVRILETSHQHLGDEATLALVRRMPNAIRLELGDNAISENGMVALAEHLPPTLRSLELWQNPIGDAGVTAMAAQHYPNLTALRVNFIDFNEAGTQALVRMDAPKLESIMVGRYQTYEDTLFFNALRASRRAALEDPALPVALPGLQRINGNDIAEMNIPTAEEINARRATLQAPDEAVTAHAIAAHASGKGVE